VPRKPPQETAVGHFSLLQRINWLCQKLWNGSQSKMARDLNVSQPNISRVLAGKRPPRRKLLMALAAYPLVNSGWLLEGQGPPLVAGESRTPQTATAGVLLPVSTTLLTGRPSEHFQACCGVWETPPSQAKPTRYWHRLSNEMSAEEAEALGLAPGDLLLIETDLSAFVDVRQLANRLCVLQPHEQASLDLRLVKTYGHTQGVVVVAKSVDKEGRMSIISSGRPQEERRFFRNVCIRRPPVTNMQQASHDKNAISKGLPPALATTEVRLLGVCILMQRSWGTSTSLALQTRETVENLVEAAKVKQEMQIQI
jgi:hypothetical protein